MRLTVSVVLLLALCPMRPGLGGELGNLKVSAQEGNPGQGAQENNEQTTQLAKGERKPLTNADVVSMVKAGLAESTIVLAIQHSSTDFDTSPQALISLKSQGIPQAILDAMITSRSEKPLPPAGPTVRTPANPAQAGASGKWGLSEEVSAVDGSHTVTLVLQAEQRVPAWNGLDAYPRLYISCKAHQTEVDIHTGSLPGDAAGGGKYSVRLQLDDGQPFTQSWDPSTGHDALSAPHPVEFARMLAVAKRLAFEFTPSASTPVATWFDLNGLAGGLGKVASACGWSVPSASRKGVESEGRTLDLHTIRKVYLEIEEWGEDDNARTRAVKGVEKHTCLQLVDTPEAADAILSWETQGLTGIYLELSAKDGLVLWNKRGLTAPFKALSQAVGCP